MESVNEGTLNRTRLLNLVLVYCKKPSLKDFTYKRTPKMKETHRVPIVIYVVRFYITMGLL